MTTLYAISSTLMGPSAGEESVVSFTTKDEYPHIGTLLALGLDKLRKWPFHILYVTDKNAEASERLKSLLTYKLENFNFEYTTESPEVIDKEITKTKFGNFNACLIDFKHHLVISTIVRPKEYDPYPHSA